MTSYTPSTAASRRSAAHARNDHHHAGITKHEMETLTVWHVVLQSWGIWITSTIHPLVVHYTVYHSMWWTDLLVLVQVAAAVEAVGRVLGDLARAEEGAAALRHALRLGVGLCT